MTLSSPPCSTTRFRVWHRLPFPGILKVDRRPDHGPLVTAPGLRGGVFPASRRHLDCWRARPAAARQSLDQRRGTRAAIFLWIGVGALLRAAGPGGFVRQPPLSVIIRGEFLAG